MNTNTTFKVGDRVRTKGAPLYSDGTEFTVTCVTDSNKDDLLGSIYTQYVSGDPKNYGVWTFGLELVEPAVETAPPLEEYATPESQRNEGLIRERNDLQSIIRRRNEQIAEQIRQIKELRAELESVFESDAFPFKPLRDLQERIGQANADKGFHEEGDTLRRETGLTSPVDGDRADAALRNYYTARLALITTEVAEAVEELRNGRQVDETWYSAKVNGSTYAWVEGEKPDVLDNALGKPEGVPSELADVVIRAFDFANEADIDLAQIIEEKLAYNNTRSHKHGREF